MGNCRKHQIIEQEEGGTALLDIIEKEEDTTLPEIIEQEESGTTLLEQLRQGSIELEVFGQPTHGGFRKLYPAQAMEALELMVKHRSEFLTKLRPLIPETLENNVDAESVIDSFHTGLANLMLGTYQDAAVGKGEWNGLDNTVDTEDEVELACRLFPHMLLKLKMKNLYGYYLPPHSVLAMNARAASFIPLLFELTNEFCPTIAKKMAKDEFDNIFRHHPCAIFYNDGVTQPPDLEDATLAVLETMRGKGWVNNEIYQDIAEKCFRSRNNRFLYRNKCSFVENRIRLLVKWDPKVLYHARMLEGILSYRGFFKGKETKVRRIWEILIELAMLHYPTALAFAFHGNAFEDACKRFGKELALQLIDKHLAMALERYNDPRHGSIRTKNTPYRFFLFLVATNKEISRDGIFILLRHNPSVIQNY